ncbi:MAG: glycosyltransferase family 4 protein [Gammaproteobacteria bacterium]|nr:glycosyltransferase family 4 protein [Gammaproteobacteria bacterium]
MPRPLTVVQMLPALEGGGVERGTLEVADALVAAGHRSIVMSAGGQLVSRLTGRGSEHVTWPVDRKSLLTLRLVGRLRAWLRAENVDILHVRSRVPAWVAYRAWKRMDPRSRPRLVTTVHGLYSVSRYSAVMTRGERVIAVSETARRYILDNYPRTDPARIVVIPRGADPRMFPYGHRPPHSWSQRWFDEHPCLLDRFVLTLPGRLTRLKGHEDFIDLIATLVAKGIQVHGLIVGGEDPRRHRYAESLRQRIAKRGVAEHITFTGQRMDMREIYASSNLVLSLSSQPESFGRTVLEALSMGVPVIGYEHGGVGEVLNRVFPEGCVVPGNRDLLVAKVQDFLGRARVVPEGQPYTLQRMLDSTLELYQTLAAAP